MAKLVEILARELKDWVSDWPAVGQASDGTLHREPFLGGHTEFSLSRASDYVTSTVTRAEWQAAVDALKAKDIASSTAAMIDAGWIDPRPPVSPSLHAQVVGRANRVSEWDGAGLPPVGTRCIVTPRNEVWGFDCVDEYECVVRGYMGEYVWLENGSLNFITSRSDKVDFRPIRTPERLAAEEREKGISDIAEDLGNKTWGVTIQEWLYDLGYRKQEPK